MLQRLLYGGLILAIGCGSVSKADDDDDDDAASGSDGGGGDDGGSDVDARGDTFLTDDIDGDWEVLVGADMSNVSTCLAHLADGTFMVTCPDGTAGALVLPNCVKTVSDTRIHGTWSTQFDGVIDEYAMYEGTGCTDPTQMGEVIELIAPMTASRQGGIEGGAGFFGAAAGLWNWVGGPMDNPEEQLHCDADIVASSARATFSVLCAGSSESVAPECNRIPHLRIEGDIASEGSFTALITNEDHYVGAGCAAAGYPEISVQPGETPMTATRQ